MRSLSYFTTITDRGGNAYFSINFSSLDKSRQPRNVSSTNFSTFLAENISVTPQVTNNFSSDLTEADDFLLAILSLVLLLIIENTFSTALLRTNRGNVSNYGFSVKQFIDMFREFRVWNLVPGQRRQRTLTRVNFSLLVIALVSLTVNLVLEGVVLYLSSPEMLKVTNDIASYTLANVVMPSWDQIQHAGALATLLPCSKITMLGVFQGNNQLSLCMVSNKTSSFDYRFELSTERVKMIMTSDVHEFGVDHLVTVGNLSTKYIGRGYFTLGDVNLINKRNRLLRERESTERDEAVATVHKQLIAFLFSQHRKKAKNSAMTLERLEALQFDFVIGTGDPVRILKTGHRTRFREVLPVRYTTTVSGIIPSGPETFRFAHAFLKGAIGVAITGPDTKDLQLETGDIVAVKDWLWKEGSRKLNWLSLSILLLAALSALFILRHLLLPVSTADIAAEYVTRQVGAELGESPIMLKDSERKYFKLP